MSGRGRRGSGPSSTSTPVGSPSSSRSTGRSGAPPRRAPRPARRSGTSPTGATLINARTELSLLNPYPTDAVVDLSFTTNQGVEAPAGFPGAGRPARRAAHGQPGRPPPPPAVHRHHRDGPVRAAGGLEDRGGHPPDDGRGRCSAPPPHPGPWPTRPPRSPGVTVTLGVPRHRHDLDLGRRRRRERGERELRDLQPRASAPPSCSCPCSSTRAWPSPLTCRSVPSR